MSQPILPDNANVEQPLTFAHPAGRIDRSGKHTAVANKHALFVVGMHRAGTSATTRLINLLGAQLPDNLLGKNDSNPNGHWESEDVIALHDSILASARSSWSDLFEINESWLNSAIAQSFVDKLIDYISHNLLDKPVFVIKDPRICLVFPLWARALQYFDITPRCILPFRNPVEVALSLTKRNAHAMPGQFFPLEHGHLLWLRYVLAAERHTRAHPRSFVSFASLLSDWEQESIRIADQLGIVWPFFDRATKKSVNEFLSREHKHYDADSNNQLLQIEPVYGSLYSLMERCVTDPYAGMHEFDTIRQQSLERLHLTETYVQSALAAIKRVDEQFNVTERNNDTLRRDYTNLFGAKCSLDEQLTHAADQLDRSEQRSSQLEEQLIHVADQLDRSEQKSSYLNQELTSVTNQLAVANRDLISEQIGSKVHRSALTLIDQYLERLSSNANVLDAEATRQRRNVSLVATNVEALLQAERETTITRHAARLHLEGLGRERLAFLKRPLAFGKAIVRRILRPDDYVRGTQGRFVVGLIEAVEKVRAAEIQHTQASAGRLVVEREALDFERRASEIEGAAAALKDEAAHVADLVNNIATRINAPRIVPDASISTDYPSIREELVKPIKVWPVERMPDLFHLRQISPQHRNAIVVHVFYPDLWDELAAAIEHLPETYDLFVTLVLNHSDHQQAIILKRFPSAHIIIFPNRGRDILPFMEIVSTGILSEYDLICKLHTKRSPHRDDGDVWRRHLVSSLLPDAIGVQKLIDAFDADPELGMIVADGQIFQGREFWEGNVEHLDWLLPLMGSDVANAMQLRFAAGSMFWVRAFVLNDLLGLPISAKDYEPEPIGIDGTLAHAVERLFSVVCHSAGLRIEQSSLVPAAANLARVERNAQPLAPMPRIVAFYLPQFHPIPENDRWWGPGFTEWTNVTKAKPLFSGHRQPRLPGELGFTDLRIPETRAAQATLAQAHGISAFCYYYYWFGGKRLLHRPLDEVVRSGEPDFPFMICWANEPWSRNWDGVDNETLVPQTYEDGWIEAFARDIAPVLKDARYLRLEGPKQRPMLMIYRIMHIPRPAEAMYELRQSLHRYGVGEVHISAGWVKLGHDEVLSEDLSALGIDSFFEFPPHRMPNVLATTNLGSMDFTGTIYSYNATVDAVLNQLRTETVDDRHHAAMMGWDNTARRGKAANIFHGATPGHFFRWLRGLVRLHSPIKQEERVIFVNAWNEWAEGTCLEPDRDFGRGWLEAVRIAVGHDKVSAPMPANKTSAPIS